MYRQLNAKLAKVRSKPDENSRKDDFCNIPFREEFLHHLVCAYKISSLARNNHAESLAGLVEHYIFDLLDWTRVHLPGFRDTFPLKDYSTHKFQIASLPDNLQELERLIEEKNLSSLELTSNINTSITQHGCKL